MAEEQSHSWASPEIRDLAADDSGTGEPGRSRAVLPGSLHARGARGDGAPLARGEAGRRGAPVPRGVPANRRLDDDGDEGRPLAAPRGSWLPSGARPGDRPAERLKIAIPAKGRLREPAVALLEDAGLGPEAPGERALAFPCRNAPVDVLLVRAEDIPEYVQDAVVDCGITGADLVRERGATVSELLRLGFGGCTLEAAVPQESAATELADLDGMRIATVFPRLAAEVLGEHRVKAELVAVTGSVEVAPRLGLADAIVDLVSSGNTLRTNGLRSLGALFSSEAVLDRGRRARRRCSLPGARSPERRRGARDPLSDDERPSRARSTGFASWFPAGARRVCCRSRSREWWRCTPSFPPRTCGDCYRSSRPRAHPRSCSCRSRGCSVERRTEGVGVSADLVRVRPVRLGAVDRRHRAVGRRAPLRGPPLRRECSGRPAAKRKARCRGGRARGGQHLSARWLRPARARDRTLRGRGAGEHRARRGGRRSHPPLRACLRRARGSRRRSRRADLSDVPGGCVPLRRRGRRGRPGPHVLLPAAQSDRLSR